MKLEHTDKSFDCTLCRSYDRDRNIEHQVLYDWKRTRWVMSSTNHADTTPNNSMLNAVNMHYPCSKALDTPLFQKYSSNFKHHKYLIFH